MEKTVSICFFFIRNHTLLIDSYLENRDLNHRSRLFSLLSIYLVDCINNDEIKRLFQIIINE